MATVDQVTLKVGVDGQASLDQLNAKLDSLDNNVKKSNASLNQIQGGVRNTAYQVQDLAVQIAGGTSAFVALGQQLPQLLSGFGTVGVVVGALAAVAVPLLQVGLKALGVDFRNLNERTSELSSSTKEFLDAQRANLPTMAGMSNSFGAMSANAKEFFQIQQQLKERKAYSDLGATLEELKDKYKSFTDEAVRSTIAAQATAGARGAGIIPNTVDESALNAIKRFNLGLTAEQAKYLGENLKDIDKKTPTEALKALNEMSVYLSANVEKSSTFRKTWDETINPILKVSNEIAELNKNIKDSEERASALNAAMLGIQSSFQPDINAARRNFDQVRAARLEGQMKIAEFERQTNEKTAQDQVDRSKEIAAFRLRTEQDVSDKVKDFAKSQTEAFLSAKLAADIKQKQLGVDSDILKLSEESKLSALNLYQYNVDILKNAQTYREALIAIGEQRRKNLISADQQSKLETTAADTRNKADAVAQEAMNRRQKDFIFLQQQTVDQEARKLSLFNSTAILNDRERKNAETIFNINEERLKQLRGIAEIANPTERAAREKEINDIYEARIASTKRQQDADKELSGNFEAGWKRAYANYIDQSKNAFEQASSLFKTFTQGMEDAFINFAKTGKLSFKSLINTMMEELLRADFRRLVAGIGGGGSGGLLGGKIIPGFLASGGPASSNQAYIVGEQGPELFVPNVNGTVVPNSQISAGTNITYNIHAVDASSFQALVARDPGFIHAVSEQGRRNLATVRR